MGHGSSKGMMAVPVYSGSMTIPITPSTFRYNGGLSKVHKGSLQNFCCLSHILIRPVGPHRRWHWPTPQPPAQYLQCWALKPLPDRLTNQPSSHQPNGPTYLPTKPNQPKQGKKQASRQAGGRQAGGRHPTNQPASQSASQRANQP